MSDRFEDPVVAEIHAIRAAMLEAAGGDIRLLIKQVAERQRRSGHRIITQPLRRAHRTKRCTRLAGCGGSRWTIKCGDRVNASVSCFRNLVWIPSTSKHRS